MDTNQETIINYLMSKIIYIHKHIFQKNIFDITGNETIEKESDKSLDFWIKYLNNLSEFKDLDDFLKHICISLLVVTSYKIRNAANSIAYRSALFLLLLHCNKNNILKDYKLGYMVFIGEENMHTFLILINKQSEKVEYIVDPTFKKVEYILNFSEQVLDYMNEVFDDYRTSVLRKMPGHYEIRFHPYCDLPYKYNDDTKNKVDNILNICKDKMNKSNFSNIFKAKFPVYLDILNKFLKLYNKKY